MICTHSIELRPPPQWHSLEKYRQPFRFSNRREINFSLKLINALDTNHKKLFLRWRQIEYQNMIHFFPFFVLCPNKEKLQNELLCRKKCCAKSLEKKTFSFKLFFFFAFSP